jgi:hypothetical protein
MRLAVAPYAALKIESSSYITAFFPPSGLRQGFYRQAGLAQRLFRSLPQNANS